ALERARTELEGFLGAYRSYGRVHARVRAVAVGSAQYRFDALARTERAQRDALGSAGSELESVEREGSEIDQELARVRGQLEGLDLSKVQHLQLVETQAVEAERVAGASAARAQADEEMAAGAARLSAAAVTDADQADDRRGSAL